MYICNFYKKLKMNELSFMGVANIVRKYSESVAKRGRISQKDII